MSWGNWSNIHHKKLRSDINFLENQPNSRKFELLKLLQHVNVIWDARQLINADVEVQERGTEPGDSEKQPKKVE